MRIYDNVLVLGTGDPAGAAELVVIPNPCRGATVLTLWGADYGCGVNKVYSLTEEPYQALLSKHKKGETVFSITEWLEQDMSEFEIIGGTQL